MAIKSIDYTGAPIWIDEATGQISYQDPASIAPLPQGIVQAIDYAGTPIWANTQTGGFSYTQPTSNAQFAFDTSPYSKYLSYAGYVADPESLFGSGYNPVSRNSVNPYFNTQNRDVLRQTATSLGLKPEDADRFALEYAQQHLNEMGQGYTEASSPAIVANAIASRLFAQAGKPYEGLTPEQVVNYIELGKQRQSALKESDQDAWKRDDLGGLAAFIGEGVQGAWEEALRHPNQILLGGVGQGADPGSAKFNNYVGNTDSYNAQTNIYGGPSDKTYQVAANQGIETGAAQAIQFALDNAAKMIGGSYLSGAIGDAADAAGYGEYADAAAAGAKAGVGAAEGGGNPSQILERAILSAILSQAGDFGDATGNTTVGDVAEVGSVAYKANQAYQSGNPGALFNAATYASGKTQAIGDFDSSAFHGGDSPYNANSFFDESRFGSNQAGGNVYDEFGNWMDGEYDQYGNFVPADQTTFGDNYGQGSYDGQGNDIFGGGNLEQSNPELFGTGSGGGLMTGLGGLLSGLGSNLGLGSLLSGNNGQGGLLNTGLALAPIAAAIQYARNQGPFDTSRLTGLADQYNPSSMAYQYDRNTEQQRQDLTSSLANRQVLGSSFGNMDLTNFNTNRELGRGALISQASLGGADIAQKILNAQIQERQLRNQMYGSALGALGNVFGGRRS